MTVLTRDENPWLRRIVAAPGSEFRLVCFPFAGGSASYFRPLAIALAPDVETLAVQYPGRQERRAEAPLESIEQLADAVADALRLVFDGRFAFFGHSLGALVAFEAARRLEASGGPGPVHLFASAVSAPSVFRPPTAHLADDETLLAELSALGGTGRPPLAAVRADYRAVARYRPQPEARTACPLTALAGTEDPLVPLDNSAAWCAHTEGGSTLRTYRGGHFYLDRHIPAVADAVTGTLAPYLPAVAH
ncbi:MULTISPECIES: alpha/beta fold hydrolase [unclassified Streptomyces]|nr:MULTISPECIES: alpha/beta fold hydrolase [unclassified Streptomyces]